MAGTSSETEGSEEFDNFPEELQKPREYVYLNELSVVGQLSSAGIGIPQSGTEAGSSSMNREYSAGVNTGFNMFQFLNVLGVKGGVKSGSADEDKFERKVEYTSPYILCILENSIESIDDVKVYTEEDIGGMKPDHKLDRGDFVKLKGVIEPLSIFNFDILFRELNAVDIEQSSATYTDELYDFIKFIIYNKYLNIEQDWSPLNHSKNLSPNDFKLYLKSYWGVASAYKSDPVSEQKYSRLFYNLNDYLRSINIRGLNEYEFSRSLQDYLEGDFDGELNKDDLSIGKDIPPMFQLYSKYIYEWERSHNLTSLNRIYEIFPILKRTYRNRQMRNNLNQILTYKDSIDRLQKSDVYEEFEMNYKNDKFDYNKLEMKVLNSEEYAEFVYAWLRRTEGVPPPHPQHLPFISEYEDIENARKQSLSHLKNWAEYPERSKRLIQDFTTDQIPVKFTVEEFEAPFGLILNRENMKTNPVRAFSRKQDYTVIGRIEDQVSSWDPTLLTKTDQIQEYRPTKQSLPLTDRFLSRTTNEFTIKPNQISMDVVEVTPENLLIEANTFVIYPIAVYW